MPMDLNSKTILIALQSTPQNRLWPAGIFLSPVTNALWETRFDPPKDAPPQSLLLTKTPSQSRTSILYNFSSDFVLREQYRDAWNHIRIGKLLQDLDALASTISIKVSIYFTLPIVLNYYYFKKKMSIIYKNICKFFFNL